MECFLVAAECVSIRGRRMEPADGRSVVRGEDGFASGLFAHPTSRWAVGRLLPAFRWSEDPVLAADPFHSGSLCSSWNIGSEGKAGGKSADATGRLPDAEGVPIARDLNDSTMGRRPT